MNADIHVHIDRLILDSDALGAANPGAVADEVRVALEDLLGKHGISGDLAAGGTKGSVHGGAITESGRLGPQVASAIHAGLSDKRGGRP